MCVHCISSLSMPAVLAEAKHFQQTLTLGTSPDVGALSVPAMRALGRRVEDFARKSCRAFPLEDTSDATSVGRKFPSSRSCTGWAVMTGHSWRA